MTDGLAMIRAQRGMQAKIARGLGITSGAVARWVRVPSDQLIEVERITGISRDKLRPDLFRGYCCHQAAA